MFISVFLRVFGRGNRLHSGKTGQRPKAESGHEQQLLGAGQCDEAQEYGNGGPEPQGLELAEACIKGCLLIGGQHQRHITAQIEAVLQNLGISAPETVLVDHPELINYAGLKWSYGNNEFKVDLDFSVGNELKAYLYDKVRNSLPLKYKDFWDSLYNFDDGYDIYNSLLFRSDSYNLRSIIEYNPYLQGDNYDRLKEILLSEDIKINPSVMDITSKKVEDKYDLINLSSIIYYYFPLNCSKI